MRQAWAPGTWGELVQGESAGRRLLVSLPSNRGSLTTATVRARPTGRPLVLGGGDKAHLAVQRLLELLDEQGLQVQLSVASSLRPGVGHASSSADILSALLATCRSLNRSLSAAALCWLAAQVEPTNPTLLGGACLFDPDRGQVLGQASLPAMTIQPISCGDAVDTVQARQQRPRWTAAHRREMGRVLELMLTGLGTGDLRTLAQASTRSALLHAERNGRTHILKSWEMVRTQRALGIAVSHSGSSVVAIYPPKFGDDCHA